MNMLRSRTGFYNFTHKLSYFNLRSFSDIIDPPGNEPPIPSYEKKSYESLKEMKARLTYQSRKRGILENDLILSSFAYEYLNDMNINMLNDYDHLINSAPNEWDIYYWSTGARPVPQEFDTPLMELLKNHVKKRSKISRQPDLN